MEIINKFPNNWKICKLKEIIDGSPQNGYYKSNMQFGCGDFNIIRMVDLYRGDYLPNCHDKINLSDVEASKFLLKKGDLLLNRTSLKLDGVGKSSVFIGENENYIFDCSIIKVRINQKLADSKYVMKFLNSKYGKNQIRRIAKTVTISTINQPDLLSLNIPVPPLEIQCQIIDILEQAETTKHLREESDELTQRFLQSVFINMFGDPMKNEKGWEIVRFGEICGITSGHGFKYSEYSNEGVKLLRINNVTFGQIVWDQIAFLPDNYIQDYAKLVLKEGDILIALNRPILGNQLKIGLMKTVDSPAILYQRVGRVDHNNDKVNPIFLYQFMRTTYFLNELSARLSGSDQPYINPTEMVKITLPLPPLPLQQEFAQIVERVEALCECQRQSASEINLLFEGLMQKAFTGELVA